MKKLVDKLYETQDLKKQEFIDLIENDKNELIEYLFLKARTVSHRYFKNTIYTRGLIEFTSYCKNDCYYCGLRKSNGKADRYRITKEEILECCIKGYDLGFRTFVLQGGEDGHYTDDRIVEIVSEIKEKFPDCAVTLSIGEKSYKSYLRYRNAGTDRYLLRHETANEVHYSKLHPKDQLLSNRKRCLYDLKKLGYQVGSGFMVGSPFQTTENLAEDLRFIKKLSPEMIGIGPFIPHKDTPFGKEKAGTLELTLKMIAILRLLIPNALIPATTALGTIHPFGREKGILAGANVVMPNLSPVIVRKKYTLYDNKLCTGEEAAECRIGLEKRMENIGYRLVVDRGDFKPID